MADVLPMVGPRVIERYCPACGYRMHQTMIDRARLDFPCSGCDQTTLADYLPIIVKTSPDLD